MFDAIGFLFLKKIQGKGGHYNKSKPPQKMGN